MDAARFHRWKTATACAFAAALALPALAQQPDTRLIDTQPRIDVGAPRDVFPEPGREPGARGTGDEHRSETERRIDFELDLKERRDARGDGDSSSRAWAVAAVFVAAGAVLLFLMTWIQRRGHR